MNLNTICEVYKLKIDSGYRVFKDYFDMVFNFLSGSISESIALLSGENNPLDSSENTSKILENVSNLIGNTATAILGLMLAVELINKLTEKGEDFRYTDAAFTGIKFAVILGVINESSTLMVAISQTASNLVIDASEAGGLTGKDGDGMNSITELGVQFISMLTNKDGLANLMSNLSVFLTSLLPTIILLLCSFIIVVVAYARFIEIQALSILSPISYSFLAFRGTSDVPKRFTFTYASVCLQALVMVLCLVLFIALQNGAYEEVKGILGNTEAREYGKEINSFKFSTIVNSILLVFSILSSGKWARSVFGL